MWMHRLLAVMIVAGIGLIPMAGCEDLPGEPRTQSAVIGGLGGAAAGALIGGEENRLVGTLIGGALGAGGGYLIGGQFEDDEDEEELAADAQQAVADAQADPATPAEALAAETADINQDDFVTIDEIVAMEEAGLTDQEIISRLAATDQVFDLSPQQEDYLLARGVSRDVIDSLATINEEERVRLLQQQ